MTLVSQVDPSKRLAAFECKIAFACQCVNMANNSAKNVKTARVLAIVHIIVGFLLICLGIADRVVEYFWTGYGCFGIWTGVWMCIAGILGIPGTRKEQTRSRNAFAGTFMGFSITSAVFGGVIIICYSISIAIYRNEYIRNYYYDEYNYGVRYTKTRHKLYGKDMALSAIILVLGIVEFAIGIWAAVCLCLIYPCGSPPRQGQVIYTTGYVMTQRGPVAFPMQTSGGMGTFQTVTPGIQGGQPQMIMVPVSTPGGYLPHLAQVTPAGAMATDCQPQQVEMPPPYTPGPCMTQQNEQV